MIADPSLASQMTDEISADESLRERLERWLNRSKA
jgi:hypothetical protein